MWEAGLKTSCLVTIARLYIFDRYRSDNFRAEYAFHFFESELVGGVVEGANRDAVVDRRHPLLIDKREAQKKIA